MRGQPGVRTGQGRSATPGSPAAVLTAGCLGGGRGGGAAQLCQRVSSASSRPRGVSPQWERPRQGCVDSTGQAEAAVLQQLRSHRSERVDFPKAVAPQDLSSNSTLLRLLRGPGPVVCSPRPPPLSEGGLSLCPICWPNGPDPALLGSCLLQHQAVPPWGAAAGWTRLAGRAWLDTPGWTRLAVSSLSERLLELTPRERARGLPAAPPSAPHPSPAWIPASAQDWPLPRGSSAWTVFMGPGLWSLLCPQGGAASLHLPGSHGGPPPRPCYPVVAPAFPGWPRCVHCLSAVRGTRSFRFQVLQTGTSAWTSLVEHL